MINVNLKRIYIATISMIVLMLGFSQAVPAQSSHSQWILGPNGSSGLANSGSIRDLSNTVKDDYVIYGKRKYGINLIWTDKLSRQERRSFKFVRSGDDDLSPLKFGELIAIHVYRGGYLKYKKRKWGINLVWSKSPVYQWKITGGVNGSQIPTRSNKVGLYNTKIKQHIVYCKRSWGINLRWAKDCKSKKSGPKELSATYSLTAQRVNQGVRPYLLNWNPGPPENAYLKSITIIKGAGFPAYTVHILKKGQSSKDCGKSSASITLRQGQTTTASQLKTLFGTSKPRPTVPIVACITQFKPGQNITRIPVRIVYVRE